MAARTISQVNERESVEIHLSDGRIYSGPRGAPVGEFLRALPEWDNPPVVGAIINHELRELTYQLRWNRASNPSQCRFQMARGFIGVL
jgi:uridine kinase